MAFDDSILTNQAKSPSSTSAFDDSILTNPSASNKESVGYKIQENKNWLSSAANAAAIGIEHGVNTISSMIGKAITPYTSKALNAVGVPMKYLETPESTQQEYLQLQHEYDTSPDTNAHPLIAGAGNIAGNLAMTAPLMAASGGAIAGLFADAATDAGLTGGLAQTAAKAAGYGLANAAQGGIMGGLMNNPTFGTQAWNPQGAKTGAILGAVVGAPLNAAVDTIGTGISNYANYANQLKSMGYNGPIFSTDVPENQGMWNSVKQSLVNKVIGRIPWINEAPGIGTTSARNSQLDAVSQATQNFVSKLADSNPNGNVNSFIKAIQNSKNLSDQLISSTSNTFRKTLEDNGITTAQMTLSHPLAQDILNTTPTGVLSKRALPALKALNSDTDINDLLTTKGITGIKNVIWNEYNRLHNLAPTSTAASDTAQDLKQLYHSINTDIGNSLQGKSPEAVQAFHTFNTITNAARTLWDPANSPDIAKAAYNLNKSQNGVLTFFNKLTKGNYTPDILNKYQSMLGQEGQKAVSNQVVQNAFNNAMKSGEFDVNRFFQDPNLTQAMNKGLVNQNVVNTLKGLQHIANKANEGLNAAKSSDTMKLALTGALGYGSMLPTVKPLLIGAQALGTLTAHPPLANTLNALSKISPDSAKGLQDYLSNKAISQLTRLGVSLTNQPNGTISFNKQ